METKKYNAKQSMNHWGNQKINEKIPGGKGKQKYNN